MISPWLILFLVLLALVIIAYFISARNNFQVSISKTTQIIQSPQTVQSAPPNLSNAGSFDYYGVNLAGMDFAPGSIPGTPGTDYFYPTNQEVDYYRKKGMNTFRIPFLWERLQPIANDPLDQNELNRLTSIVDYITKQGGKAIIDPHNYARYHNQVLGSDQAPVSYFQDFWSKLANRQSFKSNPNVVFALMNEPNQMPTKDWLSAANAGIAGIRSTGANNLILVPGNGWTGAHSWNQNWYNGANSEIMVPSADPKKGVYDKGNNFAYDIHQYLDADYSGRGSACIPFNASQMMDPFTIWARQNKVKGIVTEFGSADNSNCLTQLDSMLNYMKQNNDVYSGYTYWAGGPAWYNKEAKQDYPYSIEPIDLSNPIDKPQMNVIQKIF